MPGDMAMPHGPVEQADLQHIVLSVSSGQSVLNNTLTQVQFDNVLVNTGRWTPNPVDLGSAQVGPFTPPYYGDSRVDTWLVAGWVEWAASATGSRVATVRRNGSTTAAVGQATPVAGANTIVTFIGMINAGLLTVVPPVKSNWDLVVTQSSGGNLVIQSARLIIQKMLTGDNVFQY